MTYGKMTPALFTAILARGWRTAGAAGNSEHFFRFGGTLFVSHEEEGWRVAAFDDGLREHIGIGEDLLQLVGVAELWLSGEVSGD